MHEEGGQGRRAQEDVTTRWAGGGSRSVNALRRLSQLRTTPRRLPSRPLGQLHADMTTLTGAAIGAIVSSGMAQALSALELSARSTEPTERIDA